MNAAASWLSPSGRRGRLSVLIYHRVLPQADPMLPGEVDSESFEWQMALMAERFNVLPLRDACRRLITGRLPPRAAAITFDDGYSDNLTVAVPILKRYGLQATFFVATGFLDGGRMWNDTVIEGVRRAEGPVLDLKKPGLGRWRIETQRERNRAMQELILKLRHLEFNERLKKIQALEAHLGSSLPNDLMLTTSQLRRLADAGMDIGAHTVHHPILTRLDDERARQEIAGSKEMLEAVIDRPVELFAFPNGKPTVDYDQRHVRMARDAGFVAAFSTQWGAARGGSDVYQLPRFTPWHRSPTRFHAALLKNYFWKADGLASR